MGAATCCQVINKAAQLFLEACRRDCLIHGALEVWRAASNPERQTLPHEQLLRRAHASVLHRILVHGDLPEPRLEVQLAPHVVPPDTVQHVLDVREGVAVTSGLGVEAPVVDHQPQFV